MKSKIKEFLVENIYLIGTIVFTVAVIGGILIYENRPRQDSRLTAEEIAKLYEVEQSKPEVKVPELIIINEKASMSKTHIISSGTVKNVGEISCKFVTLKVEYLDEDGNIIGTDTKYVVGKEGIKPNAIQDFEVRTTITPSLKEATDFKFTIMSDYKVIK